MTDKKILDTLRRLLGSLYDLNKEEMYLRVIRRAHATPLRLFREPPILKVFEGIDYHLWWRMQHVSLLDSQ